MKNLKIYLADLTYNTTVIANDVFPLNIGLIASYCKKRFGNDVEIFLFKFIDELEQELYRSPPDIIGVSNYAWCKEISLHMLRLAKTLSPSTLTVMGGPNFPLDLQSQKKFMKKYTEVDIYVPIDGEEGFSNIVDCVLKNAHSKDEIQEKVLAEPIEGCISRDQYDELQFTIPVIRIKNLDEIPSPYQTGLLDQFFSKKLSPIFQSNRGCPFTCTFCVDGTDQVQKINQFSLERVKGDLEYIASHVPKNIHSLYISDLNFGMYPRDLDICKEIAEKQKKYGYPLSILCNTGKNKKERNIEAVKQLNGALNLFLSVQSLDEQVLQNIRRSNISTEQMIELVPTIKKEKLRTSSEIILGLPGDSYESHLKTIRDLLKADVDDLHMYTCMLLDGSELGSPKERQKWDLKTKFRILPKDFVKLSDGKVIVEIEEVVIETDKLTFEEYLELRSLAFIITVMKKKSRI